MIKYINEYLWNDIEVDKSKWDELLIVDFERAKPDKKGIADIWEDNSREHHIIDIESIDDLHEYLDDYQNAYVNGNHYVIKTVGYSYDSFKDLCDDLLEASICFNEHDIIDDILEKLTEDELAAFFSKSEKLRFENNKIIRDERR